MIVLGSCRYQSHRLRFMFLLLPSHGIIEDHKQQLMIHYYAGEYDCLEMHRIDEASAQLVQLRDFQKLNWVEFAIVVTAFGLTLCF